MRRRGMLAVLLALFTFGGVGLALASTPVTSPGPSISPPPKCFVMKHNALPLCEQTGDGGWTAIYPSGETVTIAPGDTSGGDTSGDGTTSSGGTSSTTRDIEILIVVAAVAGIGVIAWRQWGPGRS